MRTSVSQDRVTVTLCTEELFFCTQYIQLSHISGRYQEGGKDTDGQNSTSSKPTGSHTSQLDFSDNTGSFYQVFCEWGRRQSLFSIPGDEPPTGVVVRGAQFVSKGLRIVQQTFLTAQRNQNPFSSQL